MPNKHNIAQNVSHPIDGVVAADRVQLTVEPEPWAYERNQEAAIAAAWREHSASNPLYFNGIVHVLRGATVSGGTFAASLTRTDFASYLHWRLAGCPRAHGQSIIGAATVVSRDGQFILASQAQGHLNGGRLTCIGGIIDERDVTPDGRIDIDAQIRRELLEETGLAASELEREPGYLIVSAAPVVAIVARFRSSLHGAALVARIRSELGPHTDGELEDVVPIASRSRIAAAGDRLVPYARLLLNHLFA